MRKPAAPATGLLLAASFPNVSAWPLAWVAMVPLLLAVRGSSPKQAFGTGLLAGSVFAAATLYWVVPTITNFTAIPQIAAVGVFLALAVVVGLFVAAFCVIGEWLAARGAHRAWTLPAVWVVLEWSRTFFPAAFPWAALGYSQHAYLPMVQAADLGGVYFVSAMCVACAACAAEAFANGASRLRWAAAAVAIPVAVFAYGTMRIASVDSGDTGRTLRVGVLQGNVAQDVKWDERFQDEALTKYLDLAGEIGAGGADVIVWPESAATFYVPQDIRTKALERGAAAMEADWVVGAPAFERRSDGPPVNYNRAFHITPERGVSGHYDKIQLVPFGEYVPFGFLLSWVSKAVAVVGDFGRGEERSVFTIESGDSKARFSILICYEGIFPALTRSFVSAGADVLFNISNDAWYGDTAAPYQHIAMAAVRAVETRTPLVRSTNTGVSAAIDRSGRVLSATSLFEPAQFVVPVDVGSLGSLYALAGNWIVALSGLWIAIVALAGARRGGSS